MTKSDFTKRRFFTTGQIAKICGVSIATVQKWIDAGEIASYRLPMTASERRVSRESLLSFMKRYNVPTGEITGSSMYRVLIAGLEPTAEGQVKETLEKLHPSVEVRVCAEATEFLLLVGSLIPDAIIFDYHLPGFNALKLIESLRENDQFKGTKLVIISDLSEEDQKQLKEFKVDAIISETVKTAQLTKAMGKAVGGS